MVIGTKKMFRFLFSASSNCLVQFLLTIWSTFGGWKNLLVELVVVTLAKESLANIVHIVIQPLSTVICTDMLQIRMVYITIIFQLFSNLAFFQTVFLNCKWLANSVCYLGLNNYNIQYTWSRKSGKMSWVIYFS